MKSQRLRISATISVFLLSIASIVHLHAQSKVTVHNTDGSTKTFVPQATTTTPDGTETPTGEPPAQPARAPVSSSGWNLDAIYPYSPQDAFIDGMKSATIGTWEKPFETQAAALPPTGADGWPLTGRFGVCFFKERAVDEVQGRWTLIVSGKSSVSLSGAARTTMTVPAYDAASNTTVAFIDVGDPELYVRFDGALPIRVKLLRPGYDTDTAVFTKPFKALMSKVGLLRFMDWSATNNSLVVKWSERAKLSDASYVRGGVPYELQIALCNELGLDIWTNHPNLADDDFVVQLGKLLNGTVRPGLLIYVEASNEVWNNIFKQASQNGQQATEMVRAGNIRLTWDGTNSNPGYWSHFLYAEKVVRIKKLMGGRVQSVLSGQYGYGATTGEIAWFTIRHIRHIDKYFAADGGAKELVDVIAVAPYYNFGKLAATQPMVSDYLAGARAAVQITSSSRFKAWAAVADSGGWPLDAYEGGSHVVSPPTPTVWWAAQDLPEFEQPNVDYLTGFHVNGSKQRGRFIWFVAVARANKQFDWGATRHINNTDTPKVRAVQKVGNLYKHN